MLNGNRVIDALRLNTPEIGAVSRSLLGALAVAAVALYWVSPTAAMWAVGSAAIAGAVALQHSHGGRMLLVSAVSLQLGGAALLGALIGSHHALFVAVVAAWCFVAGMQWALGSNAGLVASAGSALLVVAPPVATTLWGVVMSAVFTVVAALLQAGLVTLWPPQQWRVERDAMTQAYRLLAADARSVADDADVSVDTAPLTWLRDAFVDSQSNHHPGEYHGGYRLPERITATLSALRARPGAERDDRLSQLLLTAADFLDVIGNPRGSRRDAEHALARVDAVAATVTGSGAATGQRLSHQLHEAAVLRFGRLRRADLIDSVRDGIGVIGRHLAWTSPVLRHAIRLAAATAASVAAVRFGVVAHGHWIALTVLIVLRPETAHTYTRCAGRVAAIAAGIAVASALTMIWQPTGMASAVCAAVFLGLTYTVSSFGYLALAAGLAASIVFMLGIDAALQGVGMTDRLIAVAIGGALAVAAHVVFPDNALIRLHQRAGELLMTEIEYAATAVQAFVHELDHPADALSSAWQRAFRARGAFEAASGATRVDSPNLRRWLRSYRAALNAVTSACTSLEGSRSSQSSTALSREFVAAVDDYVDALRGAPPSPAAPWTVDIVELAAANKKVRAVASSLAADNGAARVLVAELATITRSLTGIAVDKEGIPAS